MDGGGEVAAGAVARLGADRPVPRCVCGDRVVAAAAADSAASGQMTRGAHPEYTTITTYMHLLVALLPYRVLSCWCDRITDPLLLLLLAGRPWSSGAGASGAP